jgi:hypothetical protein
MKSTNVLCTLFGILVGQLIVVVREVKATLKGRRNQGRRDFWKRENGMGQQVTQLLDCYIIIIIIIIHYFLSQVFFLPWCFSS